MCERCGCGDEHLVPVELHEKILSANDRTARHNREHLLEEGVLAVNLMGSPGAGKTAILEATAKAIGDRLALAAIAGDLATERDAERLEKAGIPSRAITTGSACHLDAELVHDALHDAHWGRADLLFIENVGNLVCPAVYDLGEHARVVALSVTEGEDKPLKYPVIFKGADLVLLTKIDLLPHLEVNVDRIRSALAHVMPSPKMIAVSARTGEGIGEWIAWLTDRRMKVFGSLRARLGAHPGHVLRQ
jgi:hydrogenase nickel incorporation protein HypB